MNNINVNITALGIQSMHLPQSERGAEIETANLLCMWIVRR